LPKITKKYDYYTPSDLPLPDHPPDLDWKKVFQSCIHYKINMVDTPESFLVALKDFLCNSVITSSGINKFKYPSPLSIDLTDSDMISKCCNDCDFYMMTPLSEIPSAYLFFFCLSGSRDTYWGCDIRSLHEYFKTNPDDTPKNPCTNQTLATTDFDRYQQRIKLLHRNRMSLKIEAKEDETSNLGDKKKYELQVLDIFQVIYSFGYHVDHEWFLQLSHNAKQLFYYKLEDLWNYRLELTPQQKTAIVPYQIFTSQEKSSIDRLSPSDLDFLLIVRLNELISKGKTKNNKEDGAIYILLALIQVSKKAAESEGLRPLVTALLP